MNAAHQDEDLHHPDPPNALTNNQHEIDDIPEIAVRQFNESGPYLNEDQNCLPLCALCAGPLTTEVIWASVPNARWYPPLREKLLKSLTQTASPYLDASDYKNLRTRDLVANSVYDPRIINVSKIEWLDAVQAVGYEYSYVIPSDTDEDDTGDETDDDDEKEDIEVPEVEVFVLEEARPIRMDDDPVFPAILPGPNDAGLDEEEVIPCYNPIFTENEAELHDPGPCIPYHSSCHNLLQRFLRKEHNVDKVEPSLLYMAIREQIEDGNAYMSDFAYIGGGYNYTNWKWPCRPGFEYLVLDPTGNTDAIKQAIRTRGLRRPRPVSVPAGVAPEVFNMLPTELQQEVMKYLRPKEAQALITASWTMYLSTASHTFWRPYALRELPWLFELADLAGRDPEGVLDYKSICFWMDEASTLEDPGRADMFLSLVNRRRLWEDWEGLGRAYARLEEYASGFQAVYGAAGVGPLEWMRESLDKGEKLLGEEEE